METQEQKSNIDQPVVMSSLHNCEADDTVKIGGYGIAIDCCWEDAKDGKLWVCNAEYSNTVKYCPFCGYKSNVA